MKSTTFKDYLLQLVDDTTPEAEKKKKKKKKKVADADLPTGILKYLQLAQAGDQ